MTTQFVSMASAVFFSFAAALVLTPSLLATGARMRCIFLSTFARSPFFCTIFPGCKRFLIKFPYLQNELWFGYIKNVVYRFVFKAEIVLAASIVFWNSSLSYLTGSSLRCSKSCVASLMSSFPRARREAFVNRSFLGFFFFLNNLLHLERQNLKIWKLIISVYFQFRSCMMFLNNCNHTKFKTMWTEIRCL